MYGDELYQRIQKTLSGEVRFPGLTPTNLSLKGLNKHMALIESYNKLQKMREKMRNH